MHPRRKCTPQEMHHPPQEMHPTPAGDAPEPSGNHQGTVKRSFSEFWKVWPNKTAKQAARKAWDKLSAEDRESVIGACKAGWFSSWRKKHPDANPIHPASFLNGRRWEDEGEASTTVNFQAAQDAKRSRNAENIRAGRYYLLGDVSASEARELIAANLVTEDECRKVGVL